MTDTKNRGADGDDPRYAGYTNPIGELSPEEAERAEQERNEQLGAEAEAAAEDTTERYNAHLDGPLDENEATAKPTKTEPRDRKGNA